MDLNSSKMYKKNLILIWTLEILACSYHATEDLDLIIILIRTFILPFGIWFTNCTDPGPYEKNKRDSTLDEH